ncbi:hypothetical protein FACS189427_07060 [Planctomycetales bacterium]|nr:hypothetical protein FACS189427_07060 [Planctomycetales bacterium]
MKRTFAVQTLLLVSFCAVAALCSVINCCAEDNSIPIKISEPYSETFRSLEVPENISVASPVFTTFDVHPAGISPAADGRYEVRQFPLTSTGTLSNNATPQNSTLQSLTPLQDTGGKSRDRNPLDRKNDVRPNSQGNRFGINNEERSGEQKVSPPVFPSIPTGLGGTASNNTGTGTVPVFPLNNTSSNNTLPNTSARFSKPAEERRGFSIDNSFNGAENITKQSTSFRNTPSIAATLQDVFNTPPPLPQGAVDSAVIPKTLLPADTGNTELTGGTNTEAVKTAETKKEKEVAAAGTKVNGTLLVATVLLVMTLVFVVITAAEYHHRWVQSLTTLNRQYTIPLPDNGWEPAGPGGMDGYSAGIGYQNDDLPSGFVYNTSYRNPV